MNFHLRKTIMGTRKVHPCHKRDTRSLLSRLGKDRTLRRGRQPPRRRPPNWRSWPYFRVYFAARAKWHWSPGRNTEILDEGYERIVPVTCLIGCVGNLRPKGQVMALARGGACQHAIGHGVWRTQSHSGRLTRCRRQGTNSPAARQKIC